MCGIVGLFPYKFDNKDLDPRVKALIQRVLFVESLVFMEPRGKDSTGIALLWDDNETAILKQPVHARQFAVEDGLYGEDHDNPDDPDANFKYLTDHWMRGAPDVKLQLALGHVRAGTKGSEYNPHNNHPIIVQDEKLPDGGEILGNCTIGVHNGGIRNDDHLERKHKFERVGEVDSEVIFQLIHKYKDDYTIENLHQTFDELAGAYAVMAFNPSNPTKVGCMRETRPLNAAYIKQLGLLVLISERKYLDEAISEYERWRIREGESTYSYVDEHGETQEVGKVYDSFPFISAEWYDTTAADTVESGVFLLDLDTEVDSGTKVKELVQVKRVFTRAAGTTTTSTTKTGTTDTGSTGRTGSRSGGINLTNDTRSASALDDKDDEEAIDGVVDFTNYDSDSPSATAEDTIDVEGVVLNDEEVANATDELDDEEEDNSEYDGCPWSWEERLEMATDFFYSEAAERADDLTMSRLDGEGIKKLLGKFLINASTEEDAATTLAAFYDIIFPEGYAVGFGAGYDTALADSEESRGDNEFDAEELAEKVAEMEKEKATMTTAIANLTAKLRDMKSAEKKKSKAQKYISIMRPLLSHLLVKEGVVDVDGNVNDTRLEKLKTEAGLKARPNMANYIRNKVMNKGKSE